MNSDWQTPAAILVVAIAATCLLVSAIRKRRRAATGCGSAGEGCGCAAVKKSLRPPRV